MEVRDGAPESGELCALCQPRRRGREAIPPFERPRDGRPGVAALGQLDDAARRRLAQDLGQHAVVGRDEPVVARLGGNATPRRSDAGIDDGQEHRAGRKVAIGRGELQRALEHVVGGDIMRDVDERRLGADAEDDAFHRAGVVIPGPEVAEERDHRAHGQRI